MSSPEVKILLLGDADVGKSAFISRMMIGPHNLSTDLPILKDLNQPFCFDVKFSARSFRLEFYDTSSPTSYTLLQPSVIILCYDVTSRASLRSVQSYWKHTVETHFNYDEMLPVLLLGLKRDLRREGVEGMVMPYEGLNTAQEMRCDRYCECSAVTGELCAEVFEDVSRTAAMTTTTDGGRSAPPPCMIM
ncbi:P-loop containing nucleoside triphosphate hydrolase protein [Delphinella strobiligena]|nr:P-loop containing nucleoside triphosphate hydrolase protein [Delphinella strobiligena]